MKSMVGGIVKRYRITLFFTVILAVMGLVSYHIIPKQENPDVSAPGALITTIYPGASAEEVQELVTKKIEDRMTGIQGFDDMESVSKRGVSSIKVFLKVDSNVDEGLEDLKEEIENVKSKLPSGCLEPDINTDIMETPGIIIALSGKNYSYEQLGDFAEEFERKLRRVKGVARFEVVGEVEKQVKVVVDAKRLSQYEISIEDILGILKMQNTQIPSGSIQYDDGKINVITEGFFKSVDEIKNTIIAGNAQNGTVVRLADVANVDMGLDGDTKKFKQNSENAVLITGYFEDNKNIVIIGKSVREKLDQIKRTYPKDLEISEVLFQPEDVDRAIGDFIMNLLQGMVLVVIVVFVGMGLRNAAVVSAAIPFSMLMTFNIMKISNIKIHFVSTVGLIIALGMLVDNAIVVSDAIQVRLDEGMERLDAVVGGACESAIPIMTSTLTTIAAFMPLLFFPGIVGQFIGDIPRVVIIALTVSYAVAMLVASTMAYLLFRPSRGSNGKKAEKAKGFVLHLLDISLKNRRKVILIVFAMLIITMKLKAGIGMQFFPYADKEFMYADITSEIAGDMDATEELSSEVEKILKEQQEVTSCTLAIGDGLPKFYVSMFPSFPSNDFSQIMFKFDLEKGERFQTNEEFKWFLQSIMDDRIKGGNVDVQLLEYSKPLGHKIRIRVTGDRFDRIYADAKLIEGQIEKMQGTANVGNDASQKTFNFLVATDAELLSRYGLFKSDVQKQVNIALNGSNAGAYRRDSNEYDINVESNIESLDELENLKIKSSLFNNKILLKQFAAVKLESQIDTVKNYDGDMNIVVYADVKNGYNAVNIINEIEDRIDDMGIESEVVFDGERRQIQEKFGSLKTLGVFAVLAMYVILLIQFNSFVQPLIIFIAIPLSLIGVYNGLLITGKPLGFMVMLGIISLAGIVINNAILLIEEINGGRSRGLSVDEACRNSVNRRFRPVIQTTATTVMGLVPLAMSNNPLFDAMAVALMSGLLVSTLLTLIVVPTIYAVVTRENDNEFVSKE